MKYPIDILLFVKEQLENKNLVRSFSEGILADVKPIMFFGYIDDKGSVQKRGNLDDDILDDEYKDTEIRYTGYQKSLFLKDYFGNKYVIRIDTLEDIKND